MSKSPLTSRCRKVRVPILASMGQLSSSTSTTSFTSAASFWAGEQHGRHVQAGQRHVRSDAHAGETWQKLREHHSDFRWRSEEHTSELQSHVNLVCRLLLEKKKKKKKEKKNKIKTNNIHI